MLYVHEIYISSPKIQKTRGTDIEWDTLMVVDADCTTLLIITHTAPQKRKGQQYYKLVRGLV
jgi:hypothetical protein